MDPQVVLTKTAKGREEIETREYKLDQRLRQVLITVNGKLTAHQLAAQLGKAGDVAAMLDRLLREQFVAQTLPPAERLKQVRAELASVIVAALGPTGDEITLGIEGAKTLEDLRAYLESRRAILDVALGKSRAPAFWTKAATLLGPP